MQFVTAGRDRLPVASLVIALPADTKIWLAAGVTDMRRGMYGLAALVQTTLETTPYRGTYSYSAGGAGIC